MTPSEWQSSNDPDRMLRFLRGTLSPRKLRLYAAACCRRLWDSLPAPSRRAVEAVERRADGRAPWLELQAALAAAEAERT